MTFLAWQATLHKYIEGADTGSSETDTHVDGDGADSDGAKAGEKEVGGEGKRFGASANSSTSAPGDNNDSAFDGSLPTHSPLLNRVGVLPTQW